MAARARIAPAGGSGVSIELADGLGLPVLSVGAMVARPVTEQQLRAAVSGPDRLFELVWGVDFDISWPADTAKICATPNGAEIFGGSATPVGLSLADRTKATNIYDHWGQSLSFLVPGHSQDASTIC